MENWDSLGSCNNNDGTSIERKFLERLTTTRRIKLIGQIFYAKLFMTKISTIVNS
jgi:hypothetical protein